MEVTCKRCNATWETKFDRKPKRCVSCKSPYWEKELTPYWKMIREKNKENKNNVR